MDLNDFSFKRTKVICPDLSSTIFWKANHSIPPVSSNIRARGCFTKGSILFGTSRALLPLISPLTTDRHNLYVTLLPTCIEVVLWSGAARLGVNGETVLFVQVQTLHGTSPEDWVVRWLHPRSQPPMTLQEVRVNTGVTNGRHIVKHDQRANGGQKQELLWIEVGTVASSEAKHSVESQTWFMNLASPLWRQSCPAT